ncbi:MAG: hypothetical protein C0407_12690, partial [Desulfobacca sp.]|nr:hypothetical protein [Desulfobacca sp.]
MTINTPLVKKQLLTIPSPSLRDNTAEVDRLKKQIKSALGIESLTLPFDKISDWVSTMRSADYLVTATVAMTLPS